ncbi:MAG: GTP-binding protein [Firmicutes bacterium]|nr:GTP-binding protein [Bacillota bacterium]
MKLYKKDIFICLNCNELEKISHLKTINLSGFNSLDFLPESIGNLVELAELNLSNSDLKSIPKTIVGLKKLKKLSLANTYISQLPNELFSLPSLEELDLSSTDISEIPSQILSLKKLKKLILRNVKLTSLPDEIFKLKNLEYLDLHNTKISYINDEIGNLTKLKTIYLSNTNIIEIPSSFKELKQLKNVSLRNLYLKDIPNYFADLNLKFSHTYIEEENSINLYNTTIKSIDSTIWNRNTEFVQMFFKARSSQGGSVPINEVKVIFLGNGEVGKTYTIKRLLKNGENLSLEESNTERTPGIDINKKKEVLSDGRKIILQYWDFGGQEIMFSMHRCFLTSRTLYVIMLNAAAVDDLTRFNDNARDWLKTVENFANGCPVLLVINKIDACPAIGLDELSLYQEFNNLKGILKISARDFSKEKFSIVLEKIKEQVMDLPGCQNALPPSQDMVRKELFKMSKQKEKNYITNEEYITLCRKHGIVENSERQGLLDWFNDLGVSISYHNDKKTTRIEDFKVLNPQWITNAIYAIIMSASNTRNGKIEKNKIAEILKAPTKCVLRNITYTMEESEYVLDIMRKYEISHPIQDSISYISYEFIPALLEVNTPRRLNFDFVSESIFYKLEYKYLPDNVLHRLMIQMYEDVDFNTIWRKGVEFSDRLTGCKAFVVTKNQSLEIHVEKSHYGKYYFAQILNRIESINKMYNLVPDHFFVCGFKKGNEIIYRCFDYETVITNLKNGNQKICAKEDSIKIVNLLDPYGGLKYIKDNREMRDQIFICYSHKDRKFKERLAKHFNSLARRDLLIYWDDSKIEAGDKWKKEIQTALNKSCVAILLVSKDFLDSEFITEVELPTILNETYNITSIPVLIGNCLYDEVTDIKDMQLINKPSECVSILTDDEQDKLCVKIVKKAKSILEKSYVKTR